MSPHNNSSLIIKSRVASLWCSAYRSLGNRAKVRVGWLARLLEEQRAHRQDARGEALTQRHVWCICQVFTTLKKRLFYPLHASSLNFRVAGASALSAPAQGSAHPEIVRAATYVAKHLRPERRPRGSADDCCPIIATAAVPAAVPAVPATGSMLVGVPSGRQLRGARARVRAAQPGCLNCAAYTVACVRVQHLSSAERWRHATPPGLTSGPLHFRLPLAPASCANSRSTLSAMPIAHTYCVPHPQNSYSHQLAPFFPLFGRTRVPSLCVWLARIPYRNHRPALSGAPRTPPTTAPGASARPAPSVAGQTCRPRPHGRDLCHLPRLFPELVRRRLQHGVRRVHATVERRDGERSDDHRTSKSVYIIV